MVKHPPRPPRSPEEAWLDLSDRLLAGIGHALNNRVAALSAVAQVMAGSMEGPLGGALSSESVRLQDTVELLRLLVRQWEGEPEALQLEDVLRDAAGLLRHHPELRSTTVAVATDPGLLPVWGERSSLTHAFLLLLSDAALEAERRGEAELSVRCSGSPEEVRAEVPMPAAAADGQQSDAPRAGTAELLLRRAAGALDRTATALVVRLPTLPEIRRRERQQA